MQPSDVFLFYIIMLYGVRSKTKCREGAEGPGQHAMKFCCEIGVEVRGQEPRWKLW